MEPTTATRTEAVDVVMFTMEDLDWVLTYLREKDGSVVDTIITGPRTFKWIDSLCWDYSISAALLLIEDMHIARHLPDGLILFISKGKIVASTNPKWREAV